MKANLLCRSAFSLCYLRLQRSLRSGRIGGAGVTVRLAKRQLLLAKYREVGRSIVAVTLRRDVAHIYGHPISPDLKAKAVYALQPDYSLKKLNLTPAETSQLFAVMQVREGALLRDDELFKAKVFPQLKNVEWPGEAAFLAMPPAPSRTEHLGE